MARTHEDVELFASTYMEANPPFVDPICLSVVFEDWLSLENASLLRRGRQIPRRSWILT